MTTLLLTIVTLFSLFSLPAQADEPNGWSIKTVNMADGRKYFAITPNCDTFCDTPRKLVIFTHGAGGPEDILNAKLHLTNEHNRHPDVIFAYSVSKGNTKKFDVGVNYCCTFKDTGDVDYLVNVANDIASKTAVDMNDIDLYGKSNGGMLSERAACTRPDFFDDAASWAGTWRVDAPESCNTGVVNIKQWHGTKDKTVPIDGGWVYLFNRKIYVPPATELGTKIGPDSSYILKRIEGEDHVPSGAIMNEILDWLVSQ